MHRVISQRTLAHVLPTPSDFIRLPPPKLSRNSLPYLPRSQTHAADSFHSYSRHTKILPISRKPIIVLYQDKHIGIHRLKHTRMLIIMIIIPTLRIYSLHAHICIHLSKYTYIWNNSCRPTYAFVCMHLYHAHYIGVYMFIHVSVQAYHMHLAT